MSTVYFLPPERQDSIANRLDGDVPVLMTQTATKAHFQFTP
jgi:hypothetical protein